MRRFERLGAVIRQGLSDDCNADQATIELPEKEYCFGPKAHPTASRREEPVGADPLQTKWNRIFSPFRVVDMQVVPRRSDHRNGKFHIMAMGFTRADRFRSPGVFAMVARRHGTTAQTLAPAIGEPEWKSYCVSNAAISSRA